LDFIFTAWILAINFSTLGDQGINDIEEIIGSSKVKSSRLGLLLNDVGVRYY